MAQSVIAEPAVDLHAVALGLEAAGYTIATVVETRLSMGTLHTTTNPVIVLLDDQASQCIVVEMVSEQSPADSAPSFQQMFGAWRALGRPLTALAVEGHHSAVLGGGEGLVSESVGPTALTQLPVSFVQGTSTTPESSLLKITARHVAKTKVALSRAYVTVPGAVAQYVTLALLGGFSGYFLRSIWLLPTVPLVYVCAVVLKVMWCAQSTSEDSQPTQRAGSSK